MDPIPTRKLFPKLNSNLVTIIIEAVYAQRLYDEYKRKEKIYRQRKVYHAAKKGGWRVYDKQAMVIVQNLGHNQFQLCTIPVVQLERIKQKRSAKRGLFVAYRKYKNLAIIYRSEK